MDLGSDGKIIKMEFREREMVCNLNYPTKNALSEYGYKCLDSKK